MNRRHIARPVSAGLFAGLTLFVGALGMDCPADGGGQLPPEPTPAPGNRPPRIFISQVETEGGVENAVEQGGEATIFFQGEDAEDEALARIFVSTSDLPAPDQEITIISNFAVGPGTRTGFAVWDTSSFEVGAYHVFGEIDDGTFDPFTGEGNPPVRVAFTSPVVVQVPGTQPQSNPPSIEILTPAVSLGLSVEDQVTIIYRYSDNDSDVKVTLLLDKDLSPTNDDINNPGNPNDPNTNIIILPSTQRLDDDPMFDGDPPGPGQDPVQPDSVEIRTNPRFLPKTLQNTPEDDLIKEYRFTIDFAEIPASPDPLYLRATIEDEDSVVHAYAVGSLSLSRLASDIVKMEDLGFALAGARMQGFSPFENFGSDFVAVGDLDVQTEDDAGDPIPDPKGDGIEDFMVASRYGSPKNRPQVGTAYLIFGRSKVPFPADTDGNGLPDGGLLDEDGNIIDFPDPPDFLPDPYTPDNVGRFGGIVFAESVGVRFRGGVYTMPSPRPADFFGRIADITGLPEPEPAPVPVEEMRDPRLPDRPTAGLTSITRVDLNADGTPDMIFGLPWISGATDFMDDDPADGACTVGVYSEGFEDDEGMITVPFLPNVLDCSDSNNDDLHRTRIDQGSVIAVDGQADLRNRLRAFVDAGMAGQFDPDEDKPFDDEGVNREDEDLPLGMRFRGSMSPIGFFEPLEPFSPFLDPTRFISNTLFGYTVAAIPSVDGDEFDDLMISLPNRVTLVEPGRSTNVLGEPLPARGSVQVFFSRPNFFEPERYEQPVFSLPGIRTPPSLAACTEPPPDSEDPMTFCLRQTAPTAVSVEILGEEDGDNFGYATPAGDFNGGARTDILAGAPGADRKLDPNDLEPLEDNGVAYVILNGPGGFGNIDLGVNPPPLLRIVGTHDGDRFGERQAGVGDIDGDGVSDIAIASPWYDADVEGDPVEEEDVGYVGVLLGAAAPLIGTFYPQEVGTPILRGIRFLGTRAGAQAGYDVASAGDFNGDLIDDLLITSPGEQRFVDNELRLGVAYLIFGGPHLLGDQDNQVFTLDQVGTPALPGIVFISRFAFGTDDEAPLDTVGGIGDIDGDGFDDIMIGAPRADAPNPFDPVQRLEGAGEAYLIYGNKFGNNNPDTFPQ